jgi:hypothetical protein
MQDQAHLDGSLGFDSRAPSIPPTRNGDCKMRSTQGSMRCLVARPLEGTRIPHHVPAEKGTNVTLNLRICHDLPDSACVAWMKYLSTFVPRTASTRNPGPPKSRVLRFRLAIRISIFLRDVPILVSDGSGLREELGSVFLGGPSPTLVEPLSQVQMWFASIAIDIQNLHQGL